MRYETYKTDINYERLFTQANRFIQRSSEMYAKAVVPPAGMKKILTFDLTDIFGIFGHIRCREAWRLKASVYYRKEKDGSFFLFSFFSQPEGSRLKTKPKITERSLLCGDSHELILPEDSLTWECSVIGDGSPESYAETCCLYMILQRIKWRELFYGPPVIVRHPKTLDRHWKIINEPVDWTPTVVFEVDDLAGSRVDWVRVFISEHFGPVEAPDDQTIERTEHFFREPSCSDEPAGNIPGYSVLKKVGSLCLDCYEGDT